MKYTNMGPVYVTSVLDGKAFVWVHGKVQALPLEKLHPDSLADLQGHITNDNLRVDSTWLERISR